MYLAASMVRLHHCEALSSVSRYRLHYEALHSLASHADVLRGSSLCRNAWRTPKNVCVECYIFLSLPPISVSGGGAALKELNVLKLLSKAAAQRHQEFAHGRHQTCRAADVSILIIQDTQQRLDVIERGFRKCVIFVEFFWRGVSRSLGDGSWRFIRHGPPWGKIWTLWLRAHVSGDFLATLTSRISFCGRGLKTFHS